MMSVLSAIPPETISHYSAGMEYDRLSQGLGDFEKIRSQEIIQRYLPSPPKIVLDVGGGPGRYSCWLAQEGYEVHLIDPVPLHISQAQEASQNQSDHPISSINIGDARKLPQSDSSADIVLLMGPLYHLIEREDRLTALREGYRVLKPGGRVFAVGISRFASAIDGLKSGFLDDPVFQSIVERDLTDGQHRNPTNHPYYFTTTFFHHPEELRQEMIESGFQCEKLLAIEGPAWLLQNFDDHWNQPDRRERLLQIVRRIEEDPSMIGVSAHLMAIGQK
jgi:ubiquinone/menaquinone biosynthesis C-methylase UbiE